MTALQILRTRSPYLLPFTVPLLCVAGIEAGGLFSWSMLVYLGFVIPLADRLLQRPRHAAAQAPDSKWTWERSGSLRYVLYAFGLVYWAVVIWGAHRAHARNVGMLELIFLCWSLGFVGSIAVTSAHELLHKRNKPDRWAGLLTMLGLSYMFFETEHIYGHHAKPATAQDPTSAARGENFYHFFVRSTIGIVSTVRQLDKKRRRRAKMRFFDPRNESLWFLMLPILCGSFFLALWGWRGVLVFFGQGFVSYMYLEVISYIQHYGLRRKTLSDGRPEMLRAAHSWHADFPVSNYLTFELHKHADHHDDARKPYYALATEKDGPQLPFGYPLMVAIAMCPPLFHHLTEPQMPAAST